MIPAIIGIAFAIQCENTQPCGGRCIAWDQPCIVEQTIRPGQERWRIPWEVLTGDVPRVAIFVAIYMTLFGIARRHSAGVREV